MAEDQYPLTGSERRPSGRSGSEGQDRPPSEKMPPQSHDSLRMPPSGHHVKRPVSDDDEEALSPASSIGSSASAMSVSSSEDVSSPVPSPAETFSEADDRMSIASSVSSASSCKRRRRRNSSSSEFESLCSWYDPPPSQRRRTTGPCTAEAVPMPRALPVATHPPSHDPQLQGQFLQALERGDAPRVETLLREHAEASRVNVNRFDRDGQTPLAAACSRGDLEMARVLVRHGADARLRTREGWSMLHIASFCGNPELLLYLIKLGTAR